jgi:hypothetical protein
MNGYLTYEPAQLYIDLKNGQSIEIVQGMPCKVEEDTLLYNGPFCLHSSQVF